ncbi:MAG: DUF2791 family P-loop domain-containing protein [Chloroflexi bacterium]|nr:DUF2791 family P-loop domain-containing protein [Chloroflexota bacterium]
MNHSEALQLWAMLGSEGKAPTELTQASYVLPSYSVGIEPWIDRLAQLYLQNLCKRAAHFKVALAPYGGGKTHFLLNLGIRARERENYAVAYVPCGEGIGLDDPLAVYRELVKHLQLPKQDQPGLRVFLDSTARRMRESIEKREVPDVDAAFRLWVSDIRRRDYPENAFGRVLAAALQASLDDSPLGDAALRWLQGDVDTLDKSEMQAMRLAKVSAAGRKQFGRNLLLSLVKFLPEAGVNGLVLLVDEVETLFQVKRGAAALRILGAMRVILDAPTGVSGGVPLFCVFSATPDVLEEFRRYPALEQRVSVRGAAFQEGNDLAAQLHLDKMASQETLLAGIGNRLVDVGTIAVGKPFDLELQTRNARRLAQVASERSLEIDARRLFVKTWVNLLNIQASEGEREIEDDELMERYSGSFDSLEAGDMEFEP